MTFIKIYINLVGQRERERERERVSWNTLSNTQHMVSENVGPNEEIKIKNK